MQEVKSPKKPFLYYCLIVATIMVSVSYTHLAVFDVEKSPCYLCARMRRGHLYSKAKEFGCNKIALGHHYDDVIETILMGMLYGAQVQTMMPKLHSTNFEGMELIRPLLSLIHIFSFMARCSAIPRNISCGDSSGIWSCVRMT